MRAIQRRFASLAVLGAFLVGCTATGPARYPQSSDEFISTYNWGGLFQNVERMTVERPYAAVVADLKEFGKSCLDIKVNKKRAGRYATSKYERPNTEVVPLNTRVRPLKNGATGLSVQEEGDMAGLPPGGLYSMVAEARSVGKSKTEVNIYHLHRPQLANPLKRWVTGDTRDCPPL